MTTAGCMRRASVCGVSPSEPPGSLCFATSIQRGTAAVGERLSEHASRLRLGWLVEMGGYYFSEYHSQIALI